MPEKRTPFSFQHSLAVNTKRGPFPSPANGFMQKMAGQEVVRVYTREPEGQ